MDNKISVAIEKYSNFCKRDLDDRQKESNKITSKFPDRIPAILNINENLEYVNSFKIKYLTPHDLTIAQFMYVIRKRCNLDPTTALYLSINDNILASTNVIGDIYSQHKNEDGFLYVNVSSENTFG